MMSVAMIPDDLQCKVVLEAISCMTKLDWLVVSEVGGKTTTCDVHMFGANSSWSRNVHVWGEFRVMAKGKNSKTGEKGMIMMFCQLC